MIIDIIHILFYIHFYLNPPFVGTILCNKIFSNYHKLSIGTYMCLLLLFISMTEVCNLTFNTTLYFFNKYDNKPFCLIKTY